MLYKPANPVCTMDDPHDRRTVAELVEHPSGARLFPVGRLDYDTLGLLLMTDDGDLAQKLTHPKHGVRTVYRAVVKGKINDEAAAELTKGVFLADRRDGRTIGGSRNAAVHIDIVRREPTRTHLEIILREGKNRQVRRMLAKVGCPVRKLTRIAMGPLQLKGLRLGEWRDLTRDEAKRLRAAATAGKDASTRKKTSRSKKPASKDTTS